MPQWHFPPQYLPPSADLAAPAACPTEVSAASRAAGRQATRWSWMALVSAAGTSSRSCFTLKSAEHTFAWRAHQALM